MSIKYNKRPQNGLNFRKIYQHLPLQDPPKCSQIWIFGLKTNHLATLSPGHEKVKKQMKKIILPPAKT
jgi:hypothetical protein